MRFFGLQVPFGVLIGLDLDRLTALDRNAEPFEPLDLLRIVGQQPNVFDAQVVQHARRDVVGAQVGLEAELMVRFDGIRPIRLKFVRPNFVAETYAPAFLAQIEQNALAFLDHAIERRVELVSAVTFQRAKDLGRQTLAVRTD